ncbi:PREDICTED: uncharacterized protein LOC106750805 [Dinoponera quadriceps]|uniref:Uncharacterized protein LOC106750805 n=1 Tax=Dinoponera quadriceps TaxID=609295 RepID=A0A6P3YA65_DINQU|nr:PREDICTED: uncharacterized protein LOC106750805 [Dinoponera quadriceps]
MASSSSDLEELEHRKSMLDESLEEKRRMIRKRRRQKLLEEIAEKEREIQEIDEAMMNEQQEPQQTVQSDLPGKKSTPSKKAKKSHKLRDRSRKTDMDKQSSISGMKSKRLSAERTDDRKKDKSQKSERSSSPSKKKKTLYWTERKRSQSTFDDFRERKDGTVKKLAENLETLHHRFATKTETQEVSLPSIYSPDQVIKETTEEKRSIPRKQQKHCSLGTPTPYIQDTNTLKSASLIIQRINTSSSKIYSSSEDSDMIYIAPTDTHIREVKARNIKDDKLMKSAQVILQRFVQREQTPKENVIRTPVKNGHHCEESDKSVKIIKTVKSPRPTKTPKIVIKKKSKSKSKFSGSLSSDQAIAKKAKWQSGKLINNRLKKVVMKEEKYMRLTQKDIRSVHRHKKDSNTRKMLGTRRRKQIGKEKQREQGEKVAHLIKKEMVKTDEYHHSTFFLSKLSK